MLAELPPPSARTRALRPNLTGRRFGRLTGIMPAGRRHRGWVWTCECDCTAFVDVPAAVLVRGDTRSCGCLQSEVASAQMTRHGHARHGSITTEFRAWDSMLARCTNPRHKSYANYGGRGITVCDRWQGEGGFANFLADMGDKPPGLTLERIDNARGYEPANCRWATPSEQAHNRRDNKLTADDVVRIRARRGEGELLRLIAADYGVQPSTVSRIARRKRWACP